MPAPPKDRDASGGGCPADPSPVSAEDARTCLSPWRGEDLPGPQILGSARRCWRLRSRPEDPSSISAEDAGTPDQVRGRFRLSPRRGEDRRGPKEIDQAQGCSSRGRGGSHERSDKGSLLVVDELDVVGVAVDVGGVEGEEAAFGVDERAGDDVGVVDLAANFVLAAATLDGAATELAVPALAGSARDIDGCLLGRRLLTNCGSSSQPGEARQPTRGQLLWPRPTVLQRTRPWQSQGTISSKHIG